MSQLLIICAKRYNGHELWTLLGGLQIRGHTFEVVSQETLIRDELTLRPTQLDRTVYEIDPHHICETFDAVCIVSGNMEDTEAYWTDRHVENILCAFNICGKVIAAICCSVPTLGPVVKDIKVSYYPLVRSRHHLKYCGAILQNVSLTIDGNFVTAENQMITEMWTEEICNKLEGKPIANILTESGFVPKGSERMMMPEVRAAIDESRGYKMILNKDKT